MDIKNQEVTHKTYGVRTVIDQTESFITISFGAKKRHSNILMRLKTILRLAEQNFAKK